MKFKVGTSGYAYRVWRGKFYPVETKPDGMLAYYAARFDAVEINGSFYRMPEASVLRRWAEGVPRAFQFGFKAPGFITHRRWSEASAGIVKEFVTATSVLGPRLGPLLFQFPPYLKKDREFLARLIKEAPLAFLFFSREFLSQSVGCPVSHKPNVESQVASPQASRRQDILERSRTAPAAVHRNACGQSTVAPPAA